MGAFATYTFTAGVILLSLYIIYKWLLADDNQPRFNRAVLLSMYAVAFVLYPVVSLCHGLSAGTEGAIGLELPALAGTEATAGNASAPLWPRIVLGVYVTGCAAVTVWALLIVLRLTLIIAQGRREKRDGYTLVLLDRRDIAPFSWGRFVVMGRDEDSESADMILCHERAHIRAGHFIDLLIAQAVCILLWYNPASWLMLAELKDVHEYEADERVLGSGVNARQYQLLLIKKAVGIRFPSLANSLNHSKLKKRITMMYNQKSSPLRRLRALAAVPAAALSLMLLNVPVVASAIDTVSEFKVTDNSAPAQVTAADAAAVAEMPADSKAGDKNRTPDKIAEFPGGEMKMFEFMMRNMKYPEAAAKEDRQGKVVVKFKVDTDGTLSDFEVVKSVSPDLDAEALRVIKLMPAWSPAIENGKKIATYYTLPVTFKLSGGEKKASKK